MYNDKVKREIVITVVSVEKYTVYVLIININLNTINLSLCITSIYFVLSFSMKKDFRCLYVVKILQTTGPLKSK